MRICLDEEQPCRSWSREAEYTTARLDIRDGDKYDTDRDHSLRGASKGGNFEIHIWGGRLQPSRGPPCFNKCNQPGDAAKQKIKQNKLSYNFRLWMPYTRER